MWALPLLIVMMINLSFSQTFDTVTRSVSSSLTNATCSNTNGCIFNCNAHRSCQKYIICAQNGQYCEINCNYEYSCADSIILSQSTQQVIVNIIGDYAGYSSTIYTPMNMGSINVNIQTSSRGFRYGNIKTSANSYTNEINVLCTLIDDTVGSWYYDCDSLTINATFAQYLNVTALYQSEFTDSTINCPYDSSYSGTSCIIDCSGSGYCYNNNVYARNGIPQDLRYTCYSDTSKPGCISSSGYATSVYCGNNFAYYCSYIQDVSQESGWYCQDEYGTCNIPTMFPTNTPSHYPSIIPTIPSQSPSVIPSMIPAMIPTLIPTMAMPSTIETTNASKMVAPTVMPSSMPTNVPSDAPSSDPSTIPTMKPSQYPSHSPSAKPTSHPTKEIIEMSVKMVVESNVLSISSLDNSNIKSEFIQTVESGIIDVISKIYVTLDVDTLHYQLSISNSYDNDDNDNDNDSDNDDNSGKRKLQQIVTDDGNGSGNDDHGSKNTNTTDSSGDLTTTQSIIHDHEFDFDIAIEWDIVMGDMLTMVIFEDILNDYNQNISNMIVNNYFGENEAFISISVISGSSETTQDVSKGSNNNNNNNNENSQVFGLTTSELEIAGIIMLIVILGCGVACLILCVLYCKNKSSSNQIEMKPMGSQSSGSKMSHQQLSSQHSMSYLYGSGAGNSNSNIKVNMIDYDNNNKNGQSVIAMSPISMGEDNDNNNKNNNNENDDNISDYFADAIAVGGGRVTSVASGETGGKHGESISIKSGNSRNSHASSIYRVPNENENENENGNNVTGEMGMGIDDDGYGYGRESLKINHFAQRSSASVLSDDMVIFDMNNNETNAVKGEKDDNIEDTQTLAIDDGVHHAAALPLPFAESDHDNDNEINNENENENDQSDGESIYGGDSNADGQSVLTPKTPQTPAMDQNEQETNGN